ncbi:MAG: NAD(P)H-hydrate epimerase [Halobacteriales archaeon]|nr:NAD(P)H-hydrate epimerase [Halobacteriales archaeon]
MSSSPFRTPAGVRVPAVTAEEMREVDRVAVDDVGLELLQMMENAGRTLASHVFDAGAGSALVVAGNGGNGGGGLACARHLTNREVSVSVVLDREPDELTEAAATQYGILDEIGIPTGVGMGAFERNSDPDVIVDALIGYGLSGDVREPARQLIEGMNRQAASIVSLDVPSGIDATTGEALGIAAEPERVVTLALPKTGLTAVTGSLYLADIGIPRTVYDRLDIDYEMPFGTQEWVELRVSGT